MSDWRPDFNPDHLYFVTTTAVGRQHLFRRDIIKRILVDGLYYMRAADKIKLYDFVIMANHIHLIIQCLATKPLKDVMRNYKANMARLIVRHYQAERNYQALELLEKAVMRPEKQKHKVWEDGYNAKSVFSAKFLLQKMDYIHKNPLQPHWQLVERPEDYMWSSARFYITDELTIIPLDDARELL